MEKNLPHKESEADCCDPKYLAYMGMAPMQIPHWESWSCPDAETYITGIDFYEHPRQCRLEMRRRYPRLDLPVPETDEPRPRPRLGLKGPSSDRAKRTVRWGDGETATWQHGEAFFQSAEDVFAFSPLSKADFSDWPHVVVPGDYSCEQVIYERYRKNYPQEWGNTAPKGSDASVGFYNTMFMWPLLTFGWELFLETCLDQRFARIMEEFAEINRKVFRAFARLPVNFVICHDDIVGTRGPICPPEWMRRHIFKYYEEFWSIVKQAGKAVLFMSDGRMDAFADDIFSCGARGIRTEPYTDFKTIARKHEDCFLNGEGDNRVLMRNNPEEIKAMVETMVDTAHLTGGYMMGIGNHIPWNVPPEAAKLYLELSAELAHR